MVDLAQIAEIPAQSDPTPTDQDRLGRPLAPTEADFEQPPDSGETLEANTESSDDSQVTTDVIPRIPIEPIRAGRIDPEASDVTRDGPDLNGDRTLSQIGLSNRPAQVSPDQFRTGRTEIPGYEILGKLGEGGMGIVYKARQQGLNRLVALKMIIGGSQARVDLRARFRVEAEAVARLRHPNILQIYDIGELDGSPFVALELLEGGDLDDRLAGTPQPGGQAADLVATLARAVQAAHQARIVHRDLKPTNVLFTADGVPKIADFGLAKRLESDSRQTETGQIMGSPSYMAPEQARGHSKEVGPAADVYALGAILYEMLTGRPPFKGETPMETIRQVTDDDPVPPSRLVPRVARDLETICLKCLHKEPQKRYGSARELADDLDRYRDGMPIRARRTPLWERELKWSGRHPAVASSMALVIIAVIGMTGGYIVYQDRQNIRVIGANDRGMQLLYQADQAKERDQLDQAKSDLSAFLEVVKDEPKLKKISVRAEEKRQWVVDQLAILSSDEAARERDRAAQERDRMDLKRFQKFLDLRQEAQLYAAVTGVLLSADRLKKLRGSDHEALAIYAKDPRASDDAWALADSLPAALSEAAKTRLRDGCYDLLLVLAEEAQPAEGLRILDRAVRLRPETTAAYHLRRADCLGRAGDLAGRDREIRAAEQTKPETALDYFLNGRELAFRGRFADAIRPFDMAVQRDLDQTSAHLLLAICYLNARPKLLSAARTSLNACIRSNPDLVGLYLLRASIFGEEGSQACGREASDAFEAAEADYRRALELKPDDDVRYGLLANRGLLRLRSDRLDEAVADLDAAIRLEPDAYQAHTTMAQVHLRKGRLDDADAAFTRGIACRPQPIVLAGLYRSRALLHADRKDVTPVQRAAALRDLEQAIGQEPDKFLQASDHVCRARLFFQAHQCQEALAACDTALTLAPDDSEAHRVQVAALMELKQYDAVLASADAYLARGKPIAAILEIRGLAHQARSHYAGAIADFNRALAITPEAEPAQRSRLLNRRGWAYHYADAAKLALPDFEESLRLVPNQSDAYGGRGLALIRLGQWRPAVTDAEAAVRQAQVASAGSTSDEVQADQVQAFFNAARIYAQAVEFAARDVSRQGERAVALYRKNRGRALDLLEEALKRVPDQERRQEILGDPALRPLRLTPGASPGTRLRAGRGPASAKKVATHGSAEGLPEAWPGTPNHQSL